LIKLSFFPFCFPDELKQDYVDENTGEELQVR